MKTYICYVFFERNLYQLVHIMNLANFILLFAQFKQSSSIDWGMWGVIATIIAGVAIPIVLFIIQIKIKNLEIIRVSSAPLINIDSKYVDDLEIFYQGEKIEDATSVVLGVVNTGTQAITKNDFEDSVVIMFNYNTKIIKAEILKTFPASMKPTIVVEKNNIVLNPLLMNSRDSFVISAVVSSFDGKIDVTGRIKEIKVESENSKSSFNRIYTPLLGFTCGILVSLFININFPNFSISSKILLSMVYAGLGATLYLRIASRQRK